MTDLTSAFEQAQADLKNLSEKPANLALLRLYALFKQATDGDAGEDRPGMTDFVGRAKFDAWVSLRGTPQETAMKQYIEFAQELMAAA